MGTRLYPKTKSLQALEILAGVPEGTAQLLQVAEAAEAALKQQLPPSLNGVDIGYAFHQLVSPEVARLRSFQLFGWGRFNGSLVPPEDEVCGETDDPDLIRRLLQSAGAGDVDIALTEGLCWF